MFSDDGARDLSSVQALQRKHQGFQVSDDEGSVYSCFEKGCPTEKHKSERDNTERHDGLWLFTVASSSSRVFNAMDDGVRNTCLRVLKETK